MATKVTGVNGSVTIPTAAGGQTGLIYRWNGRFEREVKDVTTFDDSGNARVKRGGMMKVTGSCEAYFNGTTPAIDSGATGGVAIADAIVQGGFVLQAATGNTYSFSGAMSSIRIATEKNGDSIVTMNFESGWITGAAPLADILVTGSVT